MKRFIHGPFQWFGMRKNTVNKIIRSVAQIFLILPQLIIEGLC